MEPDRRPCGDALRQGDGTPAVPDGTPSMDGHWVRRAGRRAQFHVLLVAGGWRHSRGGPSGTGPAKRGAGRRCAGPCDAPTAGNLASGRHRHHRTGDKTYATKWRRSGKRPPRSARMTRSCKGTSWAVRPKSDGEVRQMPRFRWRRSSIAGVALAAFWPGSWCRPACRDGPWSGWWCPGRRGSARSCAPLGSASTGWPSAPSPGAWDRRGTAPSRHSAGNCRSASRHIPSPRAAPVAARRARRCARQASRRRADSGPSSRTAGPSTAHVEGHASNVDTAAAKEPVIIKPPG